MQPNTWKYFHFPKIAFPENIFFLENILHEPNKALVTPKSNANINNLSFFLGLTLDAYLKAFLTFNWANLNVPGKLWMSSFLNTKEILIQTVKSNVMDSGS